MGVLSIFVCCAVERLLMPISLGVNEGELGSSERDSTTIRQLKSWAASRKQTTVVWCRMIKYVCSSYGYFQNA